MLVCAAPTPGDFCTQVVPNGHVSACACTHTHTHTCSGQRRNAASGPHVHSRREQSGPPRPASHAHVSSHRHTPCLLHSFGHCAAARYATRSNATAVTRPRDMTQTASAARRRHAAPRKGTESVGALRNNLRCVACSESVSVKPKRLSRRINMIGGAFRNRHVTHLTIDLPTRLPWCARDVCALRARTRSLAVPPVCPSCSLLRVLCGREGLAPRSQCAAEPVRHAAARPIWSPPVDVF